MIRFLQHDSIDKVQWDICISLAINGNLYANSWFLDIVCPGWCALVEDNYETVFPLPIFAKVGIKYLRQPYFTQQLGVFFQSPLPTGKLDEFLQHIPSDFRYIFIYLNSSNLIPGLAPESEMTNLELDLSKEYEKIASGYQTNLQRNLKKASQNNLSISKNVSSDEIIAMFRANKGQDLKHMDESHYMLIKRIAEVSMLKGMGEIRGAMDGKSELVAAILWVTSHRKAIFLFSAVTQSGKQLNAMPWLIDEFIKDNAGNPLTLDFEGSTDAGLARFYRSFGAIKVIYQRYSSNTLPRILQSAMKIWQLSRRQIKKII